MAKLALLGGNQVFQPALNWQSVWPPVDESTQKKLVELYYSRQWTAFDDLESVFTQAFAAQHGSRHGVFMMNGTVTMQCALGAYGIGPGDEVIVPALTWYATAMAAYYVGAKPVLVDIDPDTLCIDAEKVRAAITDRTRAIIPVHLYGSMADMDRIVQIAKEHRLRVIEDCAHVHGGIWDGVGIGSIGDVGSFSFQHSKTMSSAEGGICITDDADIAERMFRMKHIGYAPKQLPGKASSGPPPGLVCYPFRATAFQALLLNEQLKNLDARLSGYEKAARYLENRLSQSTNIRFQSRGRKADRQSYFCWMMIFDHPSFEDIPLAVIQKAFEAEGLPLFPTWGPVYRFVLFNLGQSEYRIDGDCSVTERLSRRMLGLFHAHLGLDSENLQRIADTIEKVVSNAAELRQYSKSHADSSATSQSRGAPVSS